MVSFNSAKYFILKSQQFHTSMNNSLAFCSTVDFASWLYKLLVVDKYLTKYSIHKMCLSHKYLLNISNFSKNVWPLEQWQPLPHWPSTSFMTFTTTTSCMMLNNLCHDEILYTADFAILYLKFPPLIEIELMLQKNTTVYINTNNIK